MTSVTILMSSVTLAVDAVDDTVAVEEAEEEDDEEDDEDASAVEEEVEAEEAVAMDRRKRCVKRGQGRSTRKDCETRRKRNKQKSTRQTPHTLKKNTH